MVGSHVGGRPVHNTFGNTYSWVELCVPDADRAIFMEGCCLNLGLWHAHLHSRKESAPCYGISGTDVLGMDMGDAGTEAEGIKVSDYRRLGSRYYLLYGDGKALPYWGDTS
jgi:hypothetical protein